MSEIRVTKTKPSQPVIESVTLTLTAGEARAVAHVLKADSRKTVGAARIETHAIVPNCGLYHVANDLQKALAS